jgi:hypothetical protein
MAETPEVRKRKPRSPNSMQPAIDAHVRNSRARKIEGLLTTAPPFTEAQLARLIVLLNGHPVVEA